MSRRRLRLTPTERTLEIAVRHTLVGPPHFGQAVLLLSVTGRKSGLTRVTPLVYFEDGGNHVVVGSDGAARRDPQWCKNLKTNPQASVRVGRNRFFARATLAIGAERERLWKMGI